MDTIGKRISNLRKTKNLTQQELADLISVSDKTISKWENDLSLPGVDILPILVEKLDTNLDYLISGLESDNDTNNNINNVIDISIINKIYIYIALAFFLLLMPYIADSINSNTIFNILIGFSFFGIIFMGILVFNSYNVYKKVYKIEYKTFKVYVIVLLSMYSLSLLVNTTYFVDCILRNEFHWFWNITMILLQGSIIAGYVFILVKFIKKCKEEN